MQLRELQNAFCRSILDEWPSPLKRGVVIEGDIDVEQRIGVYRNNMFTGLANALGETFPDVKKLVGGDFFNVMAQAFIARNLPKEAPMQRYGKQFPEFIASYEPAAELPYLADVARLSWAMTEAYYAPDALRLEEEVLQTLIRQDPEQATLELQSHVRLLHCHYAADRIREFCRAGEKAPTGKVELGAAEEVFLLVRRVKDAAVYMRIAQPYYEFLCHIADGKTISAASEEVDEKILPECMRQLLSHQLIQRVKSEAL